MTDRPLGLVVGAGGLLGSAVAAELHRQRSRATVRPRFHWTEPDGFQQPFRDALDATVAEARDQSRPWAVHWCAGVGHVGASESELRAEDRLLKAAMDVIATQTDRTKGLFCFASSAGAIYAASHDEVTDESTHPSPVSKYGEAKLRHEDLVRARLAAAGVQGRRLRISNIYGPGQRMAKPQGLLSHLVVNTLNRRPSTIYVPLDTSRDYLHTSSAARMMVASGVAARVEGAPADGLRILAAERSHSIAQIIGTLARVLRRRVPFVVVQRPETRLQPLVLRFRSSDRTQHLLDTVTLEEGMASIVGTARRQMATG